MMMINKLEEWYAVYTKPRFEKKVAERLKINDFCYYCPLNTVVKQWHDRRKKVLEPLFPSYVFVKTDRKKMWQVKEIDGVVNYVYWLGKPAVIKDKEINEIKLFLEQYSDVKISNSTIKVNDLIKINSGQLKGWEAKVLSTNGRQVKLEIPSISMSLTAVVNSSDLSVIPDV